MPSGFEPVCRKPSVIAAYGRDAIMSDDEHLKKLLAQNLQRAAEEG